MELNSSYHGACPAPFYDASLFPTEGGFVAGRLCALSDLLPGNPTCCLPCPATYWTYPDCESRAIPSITLSLIRNTAFATYNAAAAWLNVVGFILLIFLLISYFFLPVQKTRSHYLSVSLVVAVLFLNLGFIVPLGAQPKQCYNAITPNDMYSSKTCAWSGAFIVAGGLSGAVWSMCYPSSPTFNLTDNDSPCPCSLNASPDLLGHRPRSQVLFRFSSTWLGRASDPVRPDTRLHRRLLSFWQCLPCQP